MRACKCPNCGANLNFDDEGREYVFCQFCGAKIDLMDQRTVHTEHTIHTEHIYDEARVKNADSIHRIVDIFASPFEEHKRKKLEAEERIRREEEEARKLREESENSFGELMEGLGVLLAVGIHFMKTYPKQILAVVGCISVLAIGGTAISTINARNAAAEYKRLADSHIAMGEIRYPSGVDADGDYRNLYKALRDAGFTNISLDPVADSSPSHENEIIEITVDGAPAFNKSGWYTPDIPIVISYHALRQISGDTSSGSRATTADYAKDSIDRATSAIQKKASDAIDDATSEVREQLADTFDSVITDFADAITDSLK